MSETLITEVPKYITVLVDNKGFWVQVSLAVITLVAVLVALFQEKIKEWFNQSVLDMKINLNPPDCHQIALSNPETGQSICSSIYIRIRVEHIKGSAAENCEIMALKFWKITRNGQKEEVQSFLPMNLIWSHFQPRTINTRIAKKLFHHCDFGFFAPFNEGNRTILKLDTMVQPNLVASGEYPNVFQPGKYEFELLLSGDNAKPLKKKWLLEFDENWTEDEQEMLTRHIKFEEIS